MAEIVDFAGLVLIVAAGFVLAVLATKVTERVAIPAPAIFLIAAAVASDLWPALNDVVQIKTVERIAVVALIVILFNGGIDVGWRRLRDVAGPVLSLGLLGTFLTAGGLAVVAHYLLGFDWPVAAVVGAALAPTDPAVTFSVLGRRELSGPAGSTLEGEAGVNDPSGIALMVGVIELTTDHAGSGWSIVGEFALAMCVGTVFGVAAGRLVLPLLRRVHLASESLYPILGLALAGTLYGVTSLAHGSGFLAVFLMGLVVGDARLPYKVEIERFHASLASLAELLVFAALGATVQLSRLSAGDWLDGLVLAVVLALAIRPIVVLITLGASRLDAREKAFVAWSGLKGAVPILLAALAVLSAVDHAQRIYGIVFVAVLASVLGQGTLVPVVARRLRIPMRERERLPWELSVRLAADPSDTHEFRVEAGSPADGQSIRELPLTDDAWISLVVRDGATIEPHGHLTLRAGDRLQVLSSSQHQQLAQVFATDATQAEQRRT
jgi:potassium/hydrogen antiporter